MTRINRQQLPSAETATRQSPFCVLDRDSRPNPVSNLFPHEAEASFRSWNKIQRFISKIAPDVTAAALHAAIRPKLQSSLDVCKLKTAHGSYASFCLYVDQAAESILLEPSFWPLGTVLKPYRGFLPNERIIERYDDPSADNVCGLQNISTRPNAFNFSSPIVLQGNPATLPSK